MDAHTQDWGRGAQEGEHKEKPEAKKSEVTKEKSEQKTEKPKKKTDPKEKKRKDGTKLILRNLATGKDETIEHVREFGTLADNKWLWYTVGTKKKIKDVSFGLFARELASGKTVNVLAGYSNVSGMTTDEEDQVVAVVED